MCAPLMGLFILNNIQLIIVPSGQNKNKAGQFLEMCYITADYHTTRFSKEPPQVYPCLQVKCY